MYFNIKCHIRRPIDQSNFSGLFVLGPLICFPMIMMILMSCSIKNQCRCLPVKQLKTICGKPATRRCAPSVCTCVLWVLCEFSPWHLHKLIIEESIEARYLSVLYSLNTSTSELTSHDGFGGRCCGGNNQIIKKPWKLSDGRFDYSLALCTFV